MDEDFESKLRNFLNLYWLRPENGLITTFKSHAFENLKIESPSLDLSCGDGMFMAIHLGATFDPNFDYFESTKASEFNHSSYVDIYNSYDSNYQVKYVKEPSMKIDYGADWKQPLLDKAKKLNLYKNLVLHDNNNLPLPFQDNYFKTIYSNSVYWVKKPDELMKELYRITSPGGKVALELRTNLGYDILYKLEEFLSQKAIDILDRKRREKAVGRKDYSEWKEMVENAGFTIEEEKSVYPHKMIVDFWNIGLRPISHLLIQMTDSLSIEERKKIKQEWVDIFFELFKPLMSLKQTYTPENSPYLYLQLKK